MSPRKEGLGILGVGAAACVACCAGPILVLLGGLGIAGLASTLVIGGVGVLIAVGAGAGFVVIRRRRHQATCASEGPVTTAVTAPSRRQP
jgi:mercuric ion transport protein